MEGVPQLSRSNVDIHVSINTPVIHNACNGLLFCFRSQPYSSSKYAVDLLSNELNARLNAQVS